ncbi:hypothetical protein CsSME_00006709 [Camellia sinensis var. sinensis]
MPEAYDQEGIVNQEKRFSVALQRYRDTNAGEKMNPFAEQEAWEDHQIGKATLKFGSKDKKKSDDYQFVFENQIDFIKASVMDGVNFQDELLTESLEESMAKSAFEKLQVCIYSFLGFGRGLGNFFLFCLHGVDTAFIFGFINYWESYGMHGVTSGLSGKPLLHRHGRSITNQTP